MKSTDRSILLFLALSLAVLLLPSFAECANELKNVANAIETSQRGMSAWQLIRAGGLIMIPLAALSIIAVAIMVYCFLTFKMEKLAPADFSDELIAKLRKGDIAAARRMCELNDNLVSQVALVGIKKSEEDPHLIAEFMEHRSRELSSKLWQMLTYLSDIATIAPLVGLIGTVMGMIQAFNAIAFQTAVAKPIMLAGGVGKAMVATVAGLVVAVPSVAAHSFFRARLQVIVNTSAAYMTDVASLISGETKRKDKR